MTAAMPLVDKVAKYDLPRAVRPTYVRRYFARKDSFVARRKPRPRTNILGLSCPNVVRARQNFTLSPRIYGTRFPTPSFPRDLFYDVVLRRNHLVRTLEHTHAISFAEIMSFPISWNENGSYEGIRGYLYRRYPYDCCSLPLCERLP